PLELLSRTYSPETQGIAGLIGGRFNVSGNLNPADIQQLQGDLDVMELDVLGVKLHQTHPTPILLSNDVVQINEGAFEVDNVSVSINGTIHPKDRGRLDLTLKTNISLEILSTLSSDITAHGTSTSNISIQGTFAQPSLTGVLEIKDGFFRHYSFPNSLTDISAILTFQDRSISLQSLKAGSSGGTITAGGSGILKGHALSDYRLDVYADKIRLQYPEGLRSTITGELHLQSEKETAYLVGDLNIV